MKINFISLPHPNLVDPEEMAPVNILYLAAILETNKDVEVSVSNFSRYTDEEALEKVVEADMYGITASVVELLQANRFAAGIKKRFPKSVIGIGGAGASSDEFIDRGVVDFVCKGEAEYEILKIVSDYKKGTLKSTYIGEKPWNLDLLPFPARHLLDTKQGGNIFAYGKRYKPGESTLLFSSRGCPFNCAFCASHFGRKVRYRSAEDVAAEIRQVIRNFNIRQFRFSEELFVFNRKRVFALCDALGKLDIRWKVSTRVKPFDKEVADVMYQAGCREVSFGVESFDNHVLKVLNKRITAEDSARALETAKKAGLITRALLMIRTPGQTKDTVSTNIRWLEKVPYDMAACTTFMPLPPSDIYVNPDKYSIEILNRNLDDYNWYLFNQKGENEFKSIIKIKDRSLEEFNEESQRFKDYIIKKARAHKG